MTNLIEKSLLIGFGAFLLIIFFSFISPLYEQTFDYYENDQKRLDECLSFFDEIDEAIKYVIKHKERSYLETVNYPSNTNITTESYYAKFDFLFDGKIETIIKKYEVQLVSYHYREISIKQYLLNVSYRLSLIDVKLQNLI